MLGKNKAARIGSALAATICAPLATVILYGLWRGAPLVFLFLIFAVFWIGFYAVGMWVMIVRPAELARKLPISSKELCSRKKAFYDWLASQGRR